MWTFTNPRDDQRQLGRGLALFTACRCSWWCQQGLPWICFLNVVKCGTINLKIIPLWGWCFLFNLLMSPILDKFGMVYSVYLWVYHLTVGPVPFVWLQIWIAEAPNNPSRGEAGLNDIYIKLTTTSVFWFIQALGFQYWRGACRKRQVVPTVAEVWLG